MPSEAAQFRSVLETAMKLSGGERDRFLDRACSDQQVRGAMDRALALLDETLETLGSSTGSAPEVETAQGPKGWCAPAASGGRVDPRSSGAGGAQRDRQFPEALRIGSFRVVRTLGAGGMGTVFEAIDERLGRRVALKAIRAEWRFDAEATARLLREAQLLAALEHPHICRLYDVIRDDGGTHLILEFVEGEPLGKARTRLRHGQRLRVAQEIASAIAAAHAAGVVHRDLKPDNVMVTPAGEAKVLDFGIARPASGAGGQPGAEDARGAFGSGAARSSPGQSEATSGVAMASVVMTSPGALVGTPLYMSPEQARSEEATPASDIFAFGLLLQELLTGESAIERGGGREAVLERVKRAELRPMRGSDRQAARLVRQLTAPDPGQRLSAAEAVRHLGRLRRRPVRRAVAALATVVLLLFVGAGVKYAVDLDRERSLAVAARGDAEDLIGFMTETLRDELAPVGRLDALGAVAERVIDYYGLHDASTLTSAQRARYAKGLTLIGEVQLARDSADLASAERAFEEARRLLTQIASEGSTEGPTGGPTDGQVLKSLGAVHFWLGNIEYRRLKLDAALEHFLAYQRLAERLVALDAANPEWQLELAYAHSNLVPLHQQRGDDAAARLALDASLEVKRRLVQLRPDDPETARSLANGLTYLADFRNRDGDAAGAHAAFAEAQKVLDASFRAAPRDAETRYRFVAVSLLHGELLGSQGRHIDALAEFHRAQDSARVLLSIDPSNAIWQRDMAIARRRAGQCHHALGGHDAARAEYEAAEGLMMALHERDPQQTRWLDDLAGIASSMGRLAESDGRWAEARRAHRVARERYERLAESAGGDGVGFTFIVLASRATAAEARSSHADGDEAACAALWRDVVERLSPWVEGTGASAAHWLVEARQLLATALLRLERLEDAEPLLTLLRDEGAMTPELDALTKSRSAESWGPDGPG